MNVKAIYFSPTETTEKITKTFCDTLSTNIDYVNITKPEIRKNITDIDADIMIFAAPVYANFIAPLAYTYFKQLKGNNTPLIVLSVYGAVSYGYSLDQFEKLAKENNFNLIGAGAFIGEHTYTNKNLQLACNRPNKEDLEEVKEFSTKILKKIEEKMSIITINENELPEEIPNGGRKLKDIIPIPTADNVVCVLCHNCVTACPTNAIDSHSIKTEDYNCIRCFACIKVCLRGARASKLPKAFEKKLNTKGNNNLKSKTIL